MQCIECDKDLLSARRTDARFCDGNCRKAFSRRAARVTKARARVLSGLAFIDDYTRRVALKRSTASVTLKGGK